MRQQPLNPSLYQINTRATLYDISLKLGRPATLDDFPDEMLDKLALQGFDWIWLLGIWQTGAVGPSVSRSHADWQTEFRQALPDLKPEDITGSCFAVTGYTVNAEFGGNSALDRIRERIHSRDMRLLLDFIPNHSAIDHPWVQTHPEFYIAGTEEQLAREPQNYIRLRTPGGTSVFAYGRDPFFPGWPDTLQLNYAEPSLQQAMLTELQRAAGLCDGVRCDMAMLVLPEVFEKTWGLRPEPFWTRAIESVRSKYPGFSFMAEVYWGLEWTLQQLGFDYTYDKRLYDRLRQGAARPVREHFEADPLFQHKSVRFLENHDEPRAAEVLPPDTYPAAAVLTYLCPGMRFFHDGQLEGRTRKLPVHLRRRPVEPVDDKISSFYQRLLPCLQLDAVRSGAWRLLDCAPAWDGNWTSDCFVCFSWQLAGRSPLIIAVNYAPNQSQCYLRIPAGIIDNQKVRLRDRSSDVFYDRDATDLISRGLYLDMPPWGHHIFEVSPDSK